MGKTILVIDDDTELCRLLEQCLENEGFEVRSIYNGKEVGDVLEKSEIDLIILDVMLPELDGFKVLKQIREKSDLPVLMLSAKGDEMSKVLGLRIGADDYITKPFGLSELIARVEGLFRRYGIVKKVEKVEKVMTYGELEIDGEKCLVSKRGTSIFLTSKEYKMLYFLAKNPQRVFTKKQLYMNIWEEEFMYDDNTIMALISRLRKKVEDNPEAPKYIQTVWGIGYRFNGEVN